MPGRRHKAYDSCRPKQNNKIQDDQKIVHGRLRLLLHPPTNGNCYHSLNPYLYRISRFLISSNYLNSNSNSSIHKPFFEFLPLLLPSKFHPMQRHHQSPKPAKKNLAGKPQIKSKNSLPIIILPSSSDYDNDQSSVCSNGSCGRRRAAEKEEIRLRKELEVEIEQELEQELIDGISDLVRRLTELKARQIVRGLVKENGGGLTNKAEGEITGTTRRWVVTSFSQRERAVHLGEDNSYDSGCSDAESTTGVFLRTNRERRNKQDAGDREKRSGR